MQAFNLTNHRKKLSWAGLSLITAGLGIYPFVSQGATTPSNGVTLGLELSPAVCSLYPNYNKLRQCIDGTPLTVNYFNTGNQGRCITANSARLSLLQENIIAKVIPDDYVRQQMWQGYGRCSGMSASNYFRSITILTARLKLPSELSNGTSYRVSHGRLLQQIATTNPQLFPQSLRLYCQMNRKNQPVLTHINICYNTIGQFAQCGTIKPTTCPNDFIIQGKY